MVPEIKASKVLNPRGPQNHFSKRLARGLDARKSSLFFEWCEPALFRVTGALVMHAFETWVTLLRNFRRYEQNSILSFLLSRSNTSSLVFAYSINGLCKATRHELPKHGAISSLLLVLNPLKGLLLKARGDGVMVKVQSWGLCLKMESGFYANWEFVLSSGEQNSCTEILLLYWSFF